MPLENPIAQNSYGGSLFTDEASWSDKVAKALKKHHGLCTKHKCNGIFTSMAGLEGLIGHYINDMNALVYDIFSSEEELDTKFEEALAKCGHCKSAKDFIESVRTVKEKLCSTIMQYVFSFGHTTTQMGEGFNDKIKGKGGLKQYLSVANIVTLFKLIDRLARDQDIVSIQLLVKLRQQDKRWSDYYQKLLNESKMKSSTDVVSCQPTSVANVYDVIHSDGTVTTVNLATKIIHLGHLYIFQPAVVVTGAPSLSCAPVSSEVWSWQVEMLRMSRTFIQFI